ncbi:MAG: hypothetical protein BWY66_00060 [bacterium ADurb.Bin374]|nr:MAG: hypothetical protein BWY66_00060 [bacterium ADurb.Bin374]
MQNVKWVRIVFEFIEGWYNSRKRHSGFDYSQERLLRGL